MNSNLKLLPAALLVAVLALAGCGGGGSDDMTPDEMPPMKTPQEECEDAGNNWHEGDCLTDQQLIDLGIKQGEQNAADEAAAKAAKALAKKLHGLLSPVVEAALVTEVPTDAGAAALLADARRDGMDESANGNVVVMVMDTEGAGVQVDTIPTANQTLTDAGNARHIMGAGFATGANEVLKHTNIKGEGDKEVTGSYLGAMGVFTCPDASTDCTSQRTDNGIKLGGTGWTFTPNTGQKYTTPDATYAEYGWWINEDLAAATNPKLGAWYAGVDGAALSTLEQDVSSATGSATYTGTAIGQAAYYHSQGGDLNVGGAFTADAELNATFGATDATRTLTGTIDNFNVNGMNPGWSVALKGGAITASSGNVPVGATTTTTWTIDGTDGDALPSAWSAQLYDIPSTGHQPTGVTGGFKAQYDSDGYMVGAFGAEQ